MRKQQSISNFLTISKTPTWVLSHLLHELIKQAAGKNVRDEIKWDIWTKQITISYNMTTKGILLRNWDTQYSTACPRWHEHTNPRWHTHALQTHMRTAKGSSWTLCQNTGKSAAAATSRSDSAAPLCSPRKVFVTKCFPSTSSYHDRTISTTSSKTTGR